MHSADATEWVDYDGDGTGDNADTDDDNDGVLDSADAFDNDVDAWDDTDGDGKADDFLISDSHNNQSVQHRGVVFHLIVAHLRYQQVRPWTSP